MTETLTAPPVVEQLAADILKARQEHLEAQIRPQDPHEYLYLSDISPCARYMFYSMTAGDKRKPFDTFGIARMESGNIWEDKIVAQLLEMGFQFIEGQVKVEIRNRSGELIGRGKIDGKIRFQNQSIPVEIKNMGENTFKQINSVEDLFKSPYTEKYLRQLLLYCYGQNAETGMFLLTDRGGIWKVLPIYLGNHLDYVERTLQNMERAYEAKKSGHVPDRIPYNHKLCGSCNFQAICQPTSVIEGGTAVEDPELEALLVRHEDLKVQADSYDEVHETVVAIFKEKEPITISGRFIVTPSRGSRKSYDTKQLPAETLKKIEKVTEFWKVKIEDVQKAPE